MSGVYDSCTDLCQWIINALTMIVSFVMEYLFDCFL